MSRYTLARFQDEFSENTTTLRFANPVGSLVQIFGRESIGCLFPGTRKI